MKNDSGIYTITCLVNNKVYVGRTETLRTRRNVHLSNLRRNSHGVQDLQDDFNKYGEENIKFEILVKCKKKFLFSEEHYWSVMLDSHNPKYGYNIQPTHPMGKVVHSRISINKTSEKRKIPIVVLDIDGKFLKEYPGIKEASEDLHTNNSMISSVALGKRTHYKEFIFVYKEKYDPHKDYKINILRYKRTVLMFNINDEFIMEFPSVSAAADYTKGNNAQMWRVLNGKRNSYMGYKWKYKYDKSIRKGLYW